MHLYHCSIKYPGHGSLNERELLFGRLKHSTFALPAKKGVYKIRSSATISKFPETLLHINLLHWFQRFIK